MTYAVSTSKVFPNTLTSSDIATGGVGSSEVTDASLGTADFATSIPAARITRTTSQGVLNATATTLNFNSERYDTAGMHSTASNIFAMFPPATGVYEISAQIRWSGGFLSGGAYIELVKNGSVVLARDENPEDHALSVSTMARLQAVDNVRVVVFQNSGATQSIAKSSESSPEFAMTWLAPGP